MRLIINTSVLRFGGAVQVATSLINECRKFPLNEYHVILGEGVRSAIDITAFPSNFFFYKVRFGVLGLRNIGKIQKELEKLEEQIKPDIVITTSGPAYWKTRAFHIVGFNLGQYIYTESPYFKMISLKRKLRWRIRRKTHFYFFKRDADAFIVQTDDVKERLGKAITGIPIYTIPNTYSHFYREQKNFPHKLPEREPGEVRFLAISHYYITKNFEILPSVIDSLRAQGFSKAKFVLTIDQANYERIIPVQYRRQIITIGAVKPAECPSLYNECDFLFLPTLMECFSASYPEAMVMGKPIVTSDLSFARSICGSAAIYFEPTNADDAASKLIYLINNPQEQAKLRSAGLERLKTYISAEERMEMIINLCEQLSATNTKKNHA